MVQEMVEKPNEGKREKGKKKSGTNKVQKKERELGQFLQMCVRKNNRPSERKAA